MHDTTLSLLFNASIETIYMVSLASFIGITLGLVLGCFLFISAKKNPLVHRCLGLCVNTVRSLPFVILLILMIPFTRWIVGTSIGTNAAIVPLAIAAIPFFSRICENALAEVPHGLIEAANAMGASTKHLISKILLPESLPSLIRGGTLTIIALIGYSAMAGVVGGGGLGELAINDGYQRFDSTVMLETVIILLLMVQLIQVVGDQLAKHRHIRSALIGSVILSLLCFAYQNWPANLRKENTLRVGVMSGWSEEVMAVAAHIAHQKYGLELQIIPFSDYVQPNTALNNHSIDVNIFQHLPYLQAQIQAHHYQLVPIAKTFVYPMGFYSKKINHLAQLKNNALVAVPNDPSNGGRALLLLQKFGLIQLKSGVSALAKVSDIVVNDHRLQFKLLDAAQLPRSLNDATLVAITNDFLNQSNMAIQQALIKEAGDSPYANLIVVREQDKQKPIFQKLIAVMHSKPVLQKTEKLFPHGAAIPAGW